MAYDIESLIKQLEEATNRPGFYSDFTDVDPTVLHQISELTQMIRTKAKGSDILEVITQLFERGMLEGARKGNANMEVAKARGLFNTLSERLNSIAADVSISSGRLDSFVTLKEGSTTGDAELVDIRSAFNGNSYPNAGTAVRKQMEDVIAIMSNYVHVISEQLLESNKTVDGIYSHNTTNVTMGTAAGYVAYKPFRVVKGQSYHLWNIALYFSKIQYDDGSIAMLSESSSPMSVSTPWTPQKSGYLYVTITKPNYDAGTFGISNGPRSWQKYNENNSYIDNYDESSQYEIVVKKDGTGDYTSLTQAVKSVPDFSDKQYIIKIYTGTYDLLSESGGDSFLATAETGGNRNGLSLINKNVRLVGVGNVILNMIIPDEKTTTNTAQNISAIECAYHNELENITVNGQNIRYVIHDETGNSDKYANTIHRFKNCKFKHLGNKSGVWFNVAAYAAGTSSGCQYEFDNCIFISPNYSAWSMHNNANQESCKVTIDGCVFSGTYAFDTDPLAIKFGYYGKNVNKNDIFIKNCQIASGKIGIRRETSSVESDNVWDPHNFTAINLITL
ncbi:MAG: pectinesterase family protein [Streptococcus orisratti]|uniref:pectinesterase family protein n=1 Tax=Streptococcus orisratti TaxID=114652 RepID=UPI002352C6DE|nr:pectinesterase family protein [Streptococcus orisratti]MCI7677863.1 pectinesterase family protein [Streptococcus orisratti]